MGGSSAKPKRKPAGDRSGGKEVDLGTPVPSIEVLWFWCRQGWKYRGFDKSLSRADRNRYADRVKYEMELIISKDFVDYFLMLSDVVRQAKLEGIAVGPARGSAAASLVCYLIRLTEVNPMDYPLMLFERFIDPNRFDLPDIDLDFEDTRRDGVRQIMIRKYGEDRVGNIGTFTRYRGKNAIDDVARVYQIPKFQVDAAKEFLVERSGGDSRFDASIMDTLELFPQVKAIFDAYPDLYHSIELEGNYKTFGVHAAGLVVGADKLSNYVATYAKNNVGEEKKTLQVLSVDKYDGEHLGLMKLDALGLKTMGMIRLAIDMLGMTLDELYDIPMDDPKTLAAFKRADVVGIFQFEGRTMKMITEEMKPDTFMDLAAVNALARPGPLHSGSTNDYIEIRHGRAARVDLHPILTEICDATEGQIIYQEQILKIVREVGKFPWTHAGKIRSIISHKEGEAAFNKMYPEFVAGAAQSGIDEELAGKIWRRMATAGTYAFNIAHCVSYSMLGFWAMWLKVHHPLEFYAAQLHKTPIDAKDGKAATLMRDMKAEKFGRNFKVLPPLAGESDVTWRAVPNGVRAGFLQIPGVGGERAKQIQEFDREVGITEWKDLTNIKGFGPKTVEKIQAFSEDPDPFGVDQVAREVYVIKKMILEGDLPGLPYPSHTAEDVPYEAIATKHTIIGRIRSKNPQDLFENYRSRTGDELDPAKIKHPELKDAMTLYLEDEHGGLMTLKVDRFTYPKYKDILWEARVNKDYCLFAAEKYPFASKTMRALSLWIIDPD